MKKTILSLTALFFIAQTIFVACKKEAPQTSTTTVTTQNNPHFLFENMPCSVNANNPFENHGQKHNDGLSAIASSPNFASISMEESHEIAFQIAFNGIPDPQCNYGAILPIYNYIDNTNFTIAETANLAFAQNHISLETKNRLLELNDLVYHCTDEEQFDNSLIAFENSVLAQGGFTPSELEMILGTSAVARYSKCYWMSAVEDTQNPWHNYVITLGESGENEFRGKFKNWWKNMTKSEKKNVVAADAAGFLVGGMTGFIGGTMFGTPIVGGIAGAVLGVGTAIVVSRKVAKP
ncbi:MAG: hypothetical protein IPK62_16490 [Bacteroidetes bacterium]|nr:hypothetical protein [Bacteroidota bacterium]